MTIPPSLVTLAPPPFTQVRLQRGCSASNQNTTQKEIVMKKILSIFLLVLILSMSLTSCGGGCKHSPGDVEYFSKGTPTCTDDGGYDEVVCCTLCGEEISRVEKYLAALGHDYQYVRCTVCGEDVMSDESALYVRCNKYETPYIYGDYILFGEYPQSIKSYNVEITETQDERGYFLGGDGNYYAAVTADPLGDGYKFTNNVDIVDGEIYYFKVDAIRWRILCEEEGRALILCDSIIDSMAYDNSDNNYKESEARAWLNTVLYETAFNKLQREIIGSASVDNSADSTGYSGNPNASENTVDKVFLLSYADVTNPEYGFEKSNTAFDEARLLKTNDYSRAKGAYSSNESEYYNVGWWWLRSPSNEDGRYVRFVRFNGRVKNTADARMSHYGIVPALWITL